MFRVSEHVRKSSSEDGGIILDVKRGQMFGLNIVGSRIVELIKTQNSPTQIAEEIASSFGVPVEIADRDVQEFLGTLEKLHLIEDHATSRVL
jgi:Coenzyme PQQ synthesis protein D (PqqD)